jgi:hypothetical protein
MYVRVRCAFLARSADSVDRLSAVWCACRVRIRSQSLPPESWLNADQGGDLRNFGPPPFAAYAQRLASRRERYAPQYLTETGGPQRSETLSAWRSRATCVQRVGDDDKFIGIGALIAVPTDG